MFTSSTSPTRSNRLARNARRGRVAVGVLALATAASAAVLASFSFARPAGAIALAEGAVYTQDGQLFEGDVTERDAQVVINAGGIVTTLDRAEVRTIEYGTPESRLRQRLVDLDSGDTPARLKIGEAALRRGLLEFASEIADEVLDRDPGNTHANELADDIARQRRLDRTKLLSQRPTQTKPTELRQNRRKDPPVNDGRDVLTEEQINRIRQIELQPADEQSRRGPSIRFNDRALQRYVESKTNVDMRDFARLSDIQKALTMINDGDEDLVKDIEVRTDPASILFYKNQVQTAVVQTCATSECHGSPEAGFKLYPEPRGDEAAYANFYTLSVGTSTIKSEGMTAFGGGETIRPLINRINPEQSLLLNFMLPRNLAEFPHPEVDNFKAAFPNAQAEQIQAIFGWIDTGLKDLRDVDYGFEIEGVTPKPTSQPASQPSN